MGKKKTVFVGETPETSKKQKSQKPDKVHVPGMKGGQGVKLVEVEEPPTVESQETKKQQKKENKARTRGKKYVENKAKVDRNKLYSLPDAIVLTKETSYSKFDGSVELHILVKKENLTVSVSLPHSTGKTKKVEVATETTLDKLKTGKVDFDILLATPEMMPKLVPFAKILGPKGLMPNPKNGTLIKSVKDAEKFSADALTVKTEKTAPVIHTVIGKVSQPEGELKANVEAVFTAVGPKQILKAYMKPTMGPSVKIAIS